MYTDTASALAFIFGPRLRVSRKTYIIAGGRGVQSSRSKYGRERDHLGLNFVIHLCTKLIERRALQHHQAHEGVAPEGAHTNTPTPFDPTNPNDGPKEIRERLTRVYGRARYVYVV